MPSQPPTEEGGPRPMTPFHAMGWASSSVLVFVLLVGVTVSLRPGAKHDVINMFVCQAAGIVGCLFLLLRVHAPERSIRDVIGARATHAAFLPLGVSLGLAMYVPTGALYAAIERRWPEPKDLADPFVDALTSDSRAVQISVALCAVVAAPVLEELFYRGALFSPLRRRSGALTVIVVTGVLFALAHLTPQKLLPLALLGVALGVLRSASGSIFPCVLTHATFNAWPTWSLLTAGRPATDAPEEPIPWAIAAASTVAAVALLLAAHRLGLRSESAGRARAADLE
ncbi:MAG: type II CAAX endopeptidase family protein [Polyangiaceae bacterium]